MDLGINNKVALVTGSNRGTGLMIAEQLAAEGARVIFHSQTEGDSAAIAEQVENAAPSGAISVLNRGPSRSFEQSTN